MNKPPLLADRAIKLMIEAVYEAETSYANWDASWITSVYDQYVKNGGITEAQFKIVEKRYGKLNDE